MRLQHRSECARRLRAPLVMWLGLAISLAVLCVPNTVPAHDIYTVVSVIAMDICVVEDRTVSQWRLWCCQMVITIYQKVMRPFPPAWRHHHQTSIVVSITQ